MEEGLPINPASTLKSLPKTGSIQFANATELVNGIEQSSEIHACAVRQAFRYTHGREERKEDEAILADAYVNYKASKWDLRTLFISLLTDDRYKVRQLSEGE